MSLGGSPVPKSHTGVIEYPTWPLADLQERDGSKDLVAKHAVHQLVVSLVEFGIDPSVITSSLQQEVNYVKEL